MQIAWGLDEVTVRKIKKSFIIGFAGFAAGTIGILANDPRVLTYLAAHPIVALGVGSFMPVVLNSLNEFRKGQSQP